MHPLLVVPPNVWVGLVAEPAEVGERPPIDELFFGIPSVDPMAALSYGLPLRERGLRISNASGRSSISEFANSLPRSVRNASMSAGGNPGAAKAAFTGHDATSR